MQKMVVHINTLSALEAETEPYVQGEAGQLSETVQIFKNGRCGNNTGE